MVVKLFDYLKRPAARSTCTWCWLRTLYLLGKPIDLILFSLDSGYTTLNVLNILEILITLSRGYLGGSVNLYREMDLSLFYSLSLRRLALLLKG